MQRHFILGIALMAGAASAVDAQTSESARREIARAEDAWRAARIKGDVGFLERFYAKEGRIQGMDGKVQSRADDIALFATGKIKPKSIEHGALDIAVYGETAVVTGVVISPAPRSAITARCICASPTCW